jgi:hypothetical protein
VKNTVLVVCVALFLVACAGPSVTRTQALSESADAPYQNVLVVSVFESFDARRYFEQELVAQLEGKGIKAVASTSMMNTKVPLNRETILDMVNKTGSDSVLLMQLVDLETAKKLKNTNPEATYNVRPTYYYNVWNVEMTEYKEPPGLELTHTIVLATQMFSVASKQPVWAIETRSQLKRDINQHTSGTSIKDEARGVVSALSRDGVIGGK